MIDRSEGRRFISISREVTARVVEHLRGSEDMCARELAERIVEETQLHTGGHDIQVGIGEDEALLGAVRVVISDGFGLRRLRDLERELAARIDATS